MASALFMDGFDHYTASEAKWTSGNFGITTGRDGVGGAADVGTTGIRRTLPQLTDSITSGFAYKNGEGTSLGPYGLIWEFNVTYNDDGFTNVRVYIDNNYMLYTQVFNNAYGVSPPTSTYAIPSTALSHDTWFYVECVVTALAINSCQLQVYVNSVLAISVSYMWNVEASRANIVGQAISLYRGYFDDYYQDTNAIWGDVRIGYIVPIADVDVEFTRSTGANNYANVDEVPPNYDTDYNYSSLGGDHDLFTMEAIDDSYDLRAIQLVMFAKKGNSGSSSVGFLMSDGVDTANLGQFYPSYNQYRYFTWMLKENPFTGAAFANATEFNALNFGYQKLT